MVVPFGSAAVKAVDPPGSFGGGAKRRRRKSSEGLPGGAAGPWQGSEASTEGTTRVPARTTHRGSDTKITRAPFPLEVARRRQP
ncbi:hypothetical protein GCM10009760_62520 [Kitasatospora kazusensis]|uniref:Uncharacterized protein n=1 Tax=Kitasatospora kazusensis TaxID=407974 RepID=A0ABP4KCU1_9ACTN